MFEKDLEERVEALERKYEDLAEKVEARKPAQEEEPTLIPGAEYDFVPSHEPKVIGRFVMRIVKVREADCTLGLTDEEWRQFSAEDDMS